MNRLKAALPTFGSNSSGTEEEDCPISVDRVALIESHQQIVQQIYTSFIPFYRGVNKTRSNPLQEGGLGLVSEIRKGSGQLQQKERLSSSWFAQTLLNCSIQVRAIQGGGGDRELKEKYSSTLELVGEAHQELANLTKVYAESLQEGFMETLQGKLDEFKQFEKLLQRAEKKRNQLKGIMNKLEKGNSKKDTRSELEHELDQAEWTYRDACEQLMRKADELEQGTASIVEALKGVIDAQLDFATNYASMLQSIRTQLPSPIASVSVSHSTSPARSRSSTLQPPPPSLAPTRMNRSLSESSAQNVPTQFSNSILSSLGPGRGTRSRSSTISKLQTQAQTDEISKDKNKDKDKDKEVKNRSRSGSMLERFALGKNKKKDKTEEQEEEDENVVEGENGQKEKDSNNRSRSNSGTGSPGRGWATPSLPTLGSFSKKPSTSSYGYGSLRDSDDQQQQQTTSSLSSSSASPSLTRIDVSSSSTSTTTSTASPSKTRRFIPPLLKRTQTAPASTSSTTPSPSSHSGRFTQPSSPLKSTFSNHHSPSPSPKTVVVRAKWAYSPNVRDPDELEFEKGDLVVVEKEVNRDWWIGRNQTTGEEGMFPSAYVVVVREQEEEEDNYGRSDHEEEEEEEDQGKRRRRRESLDGDRDSLRSSSSTSTRTFSTMDNGDSQEEEEEEDQFQSRLTQSTLKPFSSSSNILYNPSTPSSSISSTSTPRPAPPPPPSRNGSTTPRKQPPPPPPPTRRTNSGGGIPLNVRSRSEKEDEGSPFD